MTLSMKRQKEPFEHLILVINVGSTSVKWKLFTERRLEVRDEGAFDRPCDFAQAVKSILRTIGNTADVSAVANRVVHGGGRFDVERLDPLTLKELHAFDHLAPLHNPPALECAHYFLEYIPSVPQWAVFDSGYFRELPETARVYAIPKAISERYNVRRVGFHGISHEYACAEAAKKLKKPLRDLTLISVHLGGGDSVALIHRGKPVDTSMGFTPLEGLPMMTRSGDLDPGLVLYLLRKHGEKHSGLVGVSNQAESRKVYKVESDDKAALRQSQSDAVKFQVSSFKFQESLDWLEHLLNEESGLKGISGESDFLELLHKRQTDTDAKLALDVFVYKIRKYIGSYCSVSPKKPDAIVFTGPIGSGEPFVRNEVMRDLWQMKGMKMLTIPANEELAMARKVNPKLQITNSK